MGRKFTSKTAFKDKFIEYMNYCSNEKKFPNISGFCKYCDMHRDTYYAQKEYYSDTFKKIEEILEDAVLNDHTRSPAERIFYLKNKFGYKDKTEIEQHTTTNEIYKTPIEEKQELQQLLKKHNMTVLEHNNSKLS